MHYALNRPCKCRCGLQAVFENCYGASLTTGVRWLLIERRHTLMKPSLCTAFLVGTIGCGEPKTPWWTQVEASGPCTEVNLRDGLDTESGTELQNTLICLNQVEAWIPWYRSSRHWSPQPETLKPKHLALGIGALLQADLNVFDCSLSCCAPRL